MLGQKTPNTFASGGPRAGYVGGVGRGAVAFTTRSDIGPAKAALAAETGRAAVAPR